MYREDKKPIHDWVSTKTSGYWYNNRAKPINSESFDIMSNLLTSDLPATCVEATVEATSRFLQGDARHIKGIGENSIDLVITSPPYWRRRDYGHDSQLGQEPTPSAYISELTQTINLWRPFLRPHASVFINLGDSYKNGFLVGIPAMFELAMRELGWGVVNHIIWAKNSGIPEPKRNRKLVNRHESIFHLTLGRDYFFNIHALTQYLERSSNPGDVWQLHHARSKSKHLAPFPPDLVNYILLLACPTHVCTVCKKPFTPVLSPTSALNPLRPQARRALELYEKSSLTEEHLTAIRAVGISDAGKGKKIQKGAGRNAGRTQELASEAKAVLGGYFREFTFAPKHQTGWKTCSCDTSTCPGTVLDPFAGSGTTLQAAKMLGFNSVGVDLIPPTEYCDS